MYSNYSEKQRLRTYKILIIYTMIFSLEDIHGLEKLKRS